MDADRCRRRALAASVGVVMGLLYSGGAFAQEAQAVRDADNARVVMIVVVTLVALGILLSVVTLWFWRTTRPDHPALLRIEQLGARRRRSPSQPEQQVP
jgi:hypothetical protein